MTEYRADHEPHLSRLSLSHISWTFIFNFRNDDPRILGNGTLFHYSDKTYLIQGSKETTACNFEKNRAQGLFGRIGNITTISGLGKQCYETVLTTLSKTERKPVGTSDHQLIQ